MQTHLYIATRLRDTRVWRGSVIEVGRYSLCGMVWLVVLPQWIHWAATPARTTQITLQLYSTYRKLASRSHRPRETRWFFSYYVTVWRVSHPNSLGYLLAWAEDDLSHKARSVLSLQSRYVFSSYLVVTLLVVKFKYVGRGKNCRVYLGCDGYII